ncbi:helix-turn-helix domain-containing protein [Microbacterium sp. NPDC089189]|uniref:TetR/AcrR family transcriptional regulator n=1 Tax=Microbacterium sp. NPDC089189 TaxID=3154972 RepID=UPI003436C6AA
MDDASKANRRPMPRRGGIRTSSETKLLDAAEDLFFVRGIAATPIDAVIERAGVSAATLYRGYESKEALLGAALARRQRQWIDTWDAAIARETSDAARLLAVFPAIEDVRRGPRGSRWCAFLGSAAEYAGTSEEVSEAVRADTLALRRRLTDLAVPLVGDAGAAELAERLLVVVTGALAMRLRESGAAASVTARAIAEVLVADAVGAAR